MYPLPISSKRRGTSAKNQYFFLLCPRRNNFGCVTRCSLSISQHFHLHNPKQSQLLNRCGTAFGWYRLNKLLSFWNLKCWLFPSGKQRSEPENVVPTLYHLLYLTHKRGQPSSRQAVSQRAFENSLILTVATSIRSLGNNCSQDLHYKS